MPTGRGSGSLTRSKLWCFAFPRSIALPFKDGSLIGTAEVSSGDALKMHR